MAHVGSQYLEAPSLSLTYFPVGTIVGLTSIIFNQYIREKKDPYCRHDAFTVELFSNLKSNQLPIRTSGCNPLGCKFLERLYYVFSHPLMSCQINGTQAAPLQMVRFERR